MNPDEMKQAVAKAALQYVQPNMVVGIGTGSTANHFIDLLGHLDFSIKGAVASSEASAQRLRQQQIPVFGLNELYQWSEASALPLPLYVDGADEVNADLHMIKGGGGALTREKIVAAASQLFVCIADQSKQVDTLGAFPLPIEVIPMAQHSVTESLEKLGGEVRLREGFTTDNGNIILDIHGLQVTEPEQLESDMNQITGVVTNGLFAKRPANILLLGGEQGVKVYEGKIA